MKITVKQHPSSSDMMELYRDGSSEIVGLVHVDLFWNRGHRTIYAQLRKGETITFDLVEVKE